MELNYSYACDYESFYYYYNTCCMLESLFLRLSCCMMLRYVIYCSKLIKYKNIYDLMEMTNVPHVNEMYV